MTERFPGFFLNVTDTLCDRDQCLGKQTIRVVKPGVKKFPFSTVLKALEMPAFVVNVLACALVSSFCITVLNSAVN